MEQFRNDLLFWISVMRDHATFQINALAPMEIRYIQNSLYFKNFFEYSFNEVKTSENYSIIYPQIMQNLIYFIDYKKLLLDGISKCKIKINLPPSLINHQINEANEFKDIMMEYMHMGTTKPKNIITWMKIWIVDSLGHVGGITSFLDLSEGILIEEAEKIKLNFEKLLIKASEIEMIVDKTKQKYNSIDYLAQEVIKLMKEFIMYLEKVKKLINDCKIMGMGTLSPLIPDHFIREHEYFISKIKLYIGKNHDYK